MPVLLFQPRFVPLILSGQKRRTVRALRRDGRPHCKPGDPLFLRSWSGLPYRSQQRRLMAATCLRVAQVSIFDDFTRSAILIDGEWLPFATFDAFAQADGFADWKEMFRWLVDVHGFPFHGEIIHW